MVSGLALGKVISFGTAVIGSDGGHQLVNMPPGCFIFRCWHDPDTDNLAWSAGHSESVDLRHEGSNDEMTGWEPEDPSEHASSPRNHAWQSSLHAARADFARSYQNDFPSPSSSSSRLPQELGTAPELTTAIKERSLMQESLLAGQQPMRRHEPTSIDMHHYSDDFESGSDSSTRQV